MTERRRRRADNTFQEDWTGTQGRVEDVGSERERSPGRWSAATTAFPLASGLRKETSGQLHNEPADLRAWWLPRLLPEDAVQLLPCRHRIELTHVERATYARGSLGGNRGLQGRYLRDF